MASVKPPWIEGEKIPDERIQEIFRQPPDVPLRYFRSALVIGARGAGKTTLFRYLKEVHDGIAIHISLTTEFASLTKQTGYGALAYDIPSVMEPLIIGKANSLLACSIAERLVRKKCAVPHDAFFACIPQDVLSSVTQITNDNVMDIKKAIAQAVPQAFENLAELQPLPEFVTILGEALEERHGELMLLFDRADMVISPSLVPVIQLLDQSSRYVALVAMRPCPVSSSVSSLGSIPGDHYSVVHLGTHPYSREWSEFVEGAVMAQLKQEFSKIPSKVKSTILTISRDSLRTALELSARYLSVQNDSADKELIAALEDLKENQLAAAEQTLQRYHSNFRRMLNDLVKKTKAKHGKINGPLVISVEEAPGDDLFNKATRLNRFVEEGLRCGALSMPTNQRWTPGLHPTEFEIPPLLVWTKGDIVWTGTSIKPITLSMKATELLRSPGGGKKSRVIFVAYRMRIAESKGFRRQLEDLMHSRRDLATTDIIDGQVPAGVKWAEKIRDRIKKSKAVVADVTGMSLEVLFELGFAYGLRKAVIPVISKSSEIFKLPPWLAATQVGTYESREGLLSICSSISTHLSDPEYAQPPKPAQAVPPLAVWLRELEWNKHSLEQFRIAAQKESLKIEVFSELTDDENVIRRAACASLLIANLDGTEFDSLIHFVCGAIVAKPKAGTGGTLPSRVLIIEEPTQKQMSFLADSLSRCQDVVKIVSLDKIRDETLSFGKMYNKWSEKKPILRSN